MISQIKKITNFSDARQDISYSNITQQTRFEIITQSKAISQNTTASSYYVVVFLIGWTPALVHRVVQLFVTEVVFLEILQAVTFPLQGLLNCLVYSFSLSSLRNSVEEHIDSSVSWLRSQTGAFTPIDTIQSGWSNLSVLNKLLVVATFLLLAVSRSAVPFNIEQSSGYYSPVSTCNAIFFVYCTLNIQF